MGNTGSLSPRPTGGVAALQVVRPSSRAWLAVWLLCGVACLNYLDRIMLTTMRESVKEAIPMTEAQFGLLTSVFLWIYGALSPLAGFVADRYNRSFVIIGSLFVWSLMTWLTSHAVTFEQLLATRVIMGVSEACYLPAALALIADYHRGATRSLAIGIHNSGACVGSGIAGFGGWIAERHGWSFTFGLFGLIGIAYSLVLMAGLRTPPAEGDAEHSGSEAGSADFFAVVKSLFREKSYRLLLAYWGLLGVAGWGVLGWMPTYLQQQFHLGQGSAGLLTTGSLQISTVAGLLVGGILADRTSRSAERGRIFVAVAGLLLAAPAIFLTAHVSWLWPAVAGVVIFGFGRAWADGNTMPILCMVCDPRHRATGFGILNFFACSVGGVTIYAGGLLRDANMNVRQIFYASAVGLALCAILLWRIKPVGEKPSR